MTKVSFSGLQYGESNVEIKLLVDIQNDWFEIIRTRQRFIHVPPFEQIACSVYRRTIPRIICNAAVEYRLTAHGYIAVAIECYLVHDQCPLRIQRRILCDRRRKRERFCQFRVRVPASEREARPRRIGRHCCFLVIEYALAIHRRTAVAVKSNRTFALLRIGYCDVVQL